MKIWAVTIMFMYSFGYNRERTGEDIISHHLYEGQIYDIEQFDQGYSNSTGYMSGTSMAAPHVTGLAALILSVNPGLSRAEVVNKIERTAKKTGNYSSSTTSSGSQLEISAY